MLEGTISFSKKGVTHDFLLTYMLIKVNLESVLIIHIYEGPESRQLF